MNLIQIMKINFQVFFFHWLSLIFQILEFNIGFIGFINGTLEMNGNIFLKVGNILGFEIYFDTSLTVG